MCNHDSIVGVSARHNVKHLGGRDEQVIESAFKCPEWDLGIANTNLT